MLMIAARATLVVAIATLVPYDVPAQGLAEARVLFIGNSLTFANDLPAMIEAVADAAGARDSIMAATVAYPNFGLQEHWDQGDARRMIRRKEWTHVVLQQGPTSLLESRRILVEYGRKFASEIRSAGAAVVFYGVWPPSNRAQFFDAVTASYAAAADDVNAVLVPVGEGWTLAWRDDPALPFYGPDGFHPSPLGSYVAALMLYEALSGRSVPATDPSAASRHPALRSLALTPAQWAIVQKAASQANRGTRRR